MPIKKSTTKKSVTKVKVLVKEPFVPANIPMTAGEIPPKDGYNKFGVCLACNNNNPDCTHNSLSEGAGGKTVCNICGIVIN